MVLLLSTYLITQFCSKPEDVLIKQSQVIAYVTLFSMYSNIASGEFQILFTKRMKIQALYLLWYLLQITGAAEERY